MHHNKKVDAPSGTALLLGRAAAEGRGIDLGAAFGARRATAMTGARKAGDIGFAALRGGTVVGEHSVIFAGPAERIELAHKAEDRMIFARGALQAALWARGKKPGLYSMADVLGLRISDLFRDAPASQTSDTEDSDGPMSDRLLVLVRHGQSEWNLKNLFTGWRDVDLTEKGVAEARAAGRKLKAQGLALRRRLHLGAEARAAHARSDARRDRPDEIPVVQGPGAQRARLRRSRRPQQGRCAREMGRGAGADLAPLL